MRRAVLLRSVREVLGENIDVKDAAYAWNRHRWVVWYGVIVFSAIAMLAPIGGIEGWPTRIVLGLAGVGVAVMATTNYKVIAQTDSGLHVLKASRIRQVAIGKERSVEPGAILEPIGGTMIATDWRVGGHVFTVPRSSEQAMQRMAHSRLP